MEILQSFQISDNEDAFSRKNNVRNPVHEKYFGEQHSSLPWEAPRHPVSSTCLKPLELRDHTGEEN